MGSVGKSVESTDGLNRFTGDGEPHVFKGKADGDYTYERNGESEMLDFFRNESNYDSLISGMSRLEVSHMLRWTEGHFMYGQQYEGWDRMSERDQRMTQFYDDLVDKSTINQGFTVSRLASTELLLGKRVSSVTEEDLKNAMGKEIVSTGHMSTGAAETGLFINGGRSSKPIEYKFYTTGATKGVAMYIGDNRIDAWGAKQREVMVNRDTVWTPTGYHYDNNRRVWVVDMKYIGKTKHDYGKTGRLGK